MERTDLVRVCTHTQGMANAVVEKFNGIVIVIGSYEANGQRWPKHWVILSRDKAEAALGMLGGYGVIEELV